jgi:hypothetical protein
VRLCCVDMHIRNSRMPEFHGNWQMRLRATGLANSPRFSDSHSLCSVK